MTPRFVSLSPVFTIRSFAASRAFYCDRLGFELTAEGGIPATLGVVARDGFTIWLTEPAPTHPESRIGKGWIECTTDDIQALRDMLATAGVAIGEEVTTGPEDADGTPIWDQARLDSFTVHDPDGNQLVFVHHSDDPQE